MARSEDAPDAASAVVYPSPMAWKTTTFTGALRLRGMTAPIGLDGPMNRDVFRALCRTGSGLSVPLSSTGLVSHAKGCPATWSSWTICQPTAPPASVRRSRPRERACTTCRLTPRFQPDRNAFSKLKAILRKAAPRTIHGLWDTIRNALPQFTPTECANYSPQPGMAAGIIGICLVLLCQKFILRVMRWQQGQRGRVRAMAWAIATRAELIELVTWRSGRIGGFAGREHEVFRREGPRSVPKQPSEPHPVHSIIRPAPLAAALYPHRVQPNEGRER